MLSDHAPHATPRFAEHIGLEPLSIASMVEAGNWKWRVVATQYGRLGRVYSTCCQP